MRTTLFSTALIACAIASCQPQQSSTDQKNINMEQTTDKPAIEQLLFAYRDALNASDVAKVLPLYTRDGVFMPSNAPTAAGQTQVKAAYEFVFSNIQLHIEFFIDTIEVHGDVAVAQTRSSGTTLIHASGETVPEENRELFVLHKENGAWKIARYMFNKTK